MKRAYDVCSNIRDWGSLLLLLIVYWFDLLREHALWVGFLLLPFVFFAAIAAILNRLLPPEQREEVEVTWRLRIHHPYWDLFILALLDLLCFLSPFEKFFFWNPLIIGLGAISLAAYFYGLIYARWRKRRPKK